MYLCVPHPNNSDVIHPQDMRSQRNEVGASLNFRHEKDPRKYKNWRYCILKYICGTTYRISVPLSVVPFSAIMIVVDDNTNMFPAHPCSAQLI